jgi:hypothetical protein
MQLGPDSRLSLSSYLPSFRGAISTRSSISASKSRALVYARALVGICALLLLGLEILSIYLEKHYSATYTRVSRQYSEALEVRPSRPGEPASVLMVGNSLLLAGIDLDRLREMSSGSMRIYPLFLEATGYYDWLYGLRRLFQQGARPQVVIVGLPVNSFLETAMRQDYSPKMLLDARDVLSAASDLSLDHTAASNLLVAHASTFWDTRGALRARILSGIVPHFEDLLSFVKPKWTLPQDPEFEALAISRLRALRELCESQGAKLIILVPPTPSSESAARRMAIASNKVGVRTLVPLDPTAVPARFYQSDATHLNSEGEALFTSALATVLPEIMARETMASPYFEVLGRP